MKSEPHGNARHYVRKGWVQKTDFSGVDISGSIGYRNKRDHLFGIVVSTSDCHPRGPGFDSRLYPRNFSGSIRSATGSTQPREDNWVATWMRSSEIRLRKLKLRLRDKRFANHKASCTAIWQQPLQSVLALRRCSATDLFFNVYSILWWTFL